MSVFMSALVDELEKIAAVDTEGSSATLADIQREMDAQSAAKNRTIRDSVLGLGALLGTIGAVAGGARGAMRASKYNQIMKDPVRKQRLFKTYPELQKVKLPQSLSVWKKGLGGAVGGGIHSGVLGAGLGALSGALQPPHETVMQEERRRLGVYRGGQPCPHSCTTYSTS